MRNYNVYLETPRGTDGEGGGLGELLYGETEREREIASWGGIWQATKREVQGGERWFVEGSGGGKVLSGG